MMDFFMDHRVGTLVVTVVGLIGALIITLLVLQNAVRELQPWNHMTLLYWLTNRRDWIRLWDAHNVYETEDGRFQAVIYHEPSSGLHVTVRDMKSAICATLHAQVTSDAGHQVENSGNPVWVPS